MKYEKWLPLCLALFCTLIGVFYSGKIMVHSSYWKPAVPSWESSYQVAKTWGAPLGFLTDNPFVGTRDSLDFRDTFDFSNFFANFVFWLVPAYPMFLLMRAISLQRKTEREYSRREKSL